MSRKLRPQNRKELVTMVVVFSAVLVVSAIAVYYLTGNREATETTRQTAQTNPSINEPAPPSMRATPTPVASNDDNVIDRLFGTRASESRLDNKRWLENLGTIGLRLLLAALLGAALAFRPRRLIFGFKRNPYVSQTQILLAIVAAALMIIVGDNAARAFGIFAAVSLVRFRTNIRDPKEITVLLISLALGLASGVGRWDLELVLGTFALVVLWLLELREPDVVFRSMEIKLTTKDLISTQHALTEIIRKHGFEAELRMIDRGRDDTDVAGELVYSVDVSPTVSTDEISEELFAIDERNIQAISWDQKKNYSYLYQ